MIYAGTTYWFYRRRQHGYGPWKGIRQGGIDGRGESAGGRSSQSARTRFAQATSGQVTDDNIIVAEKSDVLFLAVKPQQLALVAGELAGKISPKTLVVSIAAGVRLSRLAGWLGETVRLVRVMPNTPCLIGEGASCYCLGERATQADGELVGKLLDAVGTAWLVEEKMLDAVTGLSGGGPAYVYVIIEALSDAGVRVGLPRHIADRLGRANRARRGRNGANDRRTPGGA